LTIEFIDNSYPNEEILVNKNHIENCGDCINSQNYFKGKKWMELIDDDKVVGLNINFLTHNAWHYFLPAYLIANIKRDYFYIYEVDIDEDHSCENLVDWKKRLVNWKVERFNTLTKIEMEQVIKYLELTIEFVDYVKEFNIKRRLRLPKKNKCICAIEFWNKLHDAKQ
jgi:hypothetical protein